MRARSNTWRGDRRGHRIAALIGRAGKSRRRKGPRDPLRYLAAAGVSMAALRKYRRKHSVSKRRKSRVTRRRGIAVNRGGSYRSFVKAGFARLRPRGAGAARAAMRKIAAAWRSGRGVARNQGIPGQVTFNVGRRRGRKGRKSHRANSRSRRRGARRNGPILPYMAFENRGKGRKRRRHGARRNGAILPYASFNAGSSPTGGVMGALKTAVTPNFWTSTVIPLGVGFFGSQLAGGAVYGLVTKIMGESTGIVGSVQRVGSRLLGAAALGAVTLMVTKKKDIATRVLAGGLVAVLASVLQEVLSRDVYEKITGMSGMVGGMAADLTEELKQRIAQSVRGEIAAAEGGGGVSAFVNTQDLQVSPNLGPGPRIQGIDGMGAFVNTQDLRTAPTPGSDTPSVVADLSAFSDSMADMMLV